MFESIDSNYIKNGVGGLNMVVFELTHIFHYEGSVLFIEPISLGFFASEQKIQEAIAYYLTKPGFSENPNAFSVRQRTVEGCIHEPFLYEAMVYIHTEDYEEECNFELGLFSNIATAQKAVEVYTHNNKHLCLPCNVIVERIINRREINKKEWIEGFSVSDKR